MPSISGPLASFGAQPAVGSPVGSFFRLMVCMSVTQSLAEHGEPTSSSWVFVIDAGQRCLA